MTSQITFYLSQILGQNYISDDGTVLGKIRDFLIDQSSLPGMEAEPVRPRVVAIKVKKGNEFRILDFSSFEIKKFIKIIITSILFIVSRRHRCLHL